jgi:RND family efflux transporter MFP subunit
MTARLQPFPLRLSTATALALLLAAAGGCKGGADPGEDSATPPVAAIQTARASGGSLAEAVPVYGLAEPASGAETALTAPVEAFVGQLRVANGAHVLAGEAIATLTASPASRLELARAAVDAATAGAAVARAQRLRADGLMSDADVEAAQAAARSAALNRDSLTRRAAQLTLRAPVAGNVEGLTAHAGDLVATGATLARVVAGDRLRVRFGIDPLLARRVRPGMVLTMTMPGKDTSLTTRVQSIDPVVDPATRQAALIAPIPPGTPIGPGEAVRGSIAIPGAGNAVTIPYAALLDDGGESFVFVIDKGLAHRRAVTIGATTGNLVAVTGGLRAGESVAVSGGTALSEGMKVRDTGAAAPK